MPCIEAINQLVRHQQHSLALNVDFQAKGSGTGRIGADMTNTPAELTRAFVLIHGLSFASMISSPMLTD